MAQYTCPLCKMPFTASAAAGPARVRCPHCQQAVEVPAALASRWFLARDKKKFGPYNWQQLLTLSQRGDVRPADMLLQEGAKQWLRADAVPGLFPTTSAAADQPKRLDPSRVAAPAAKKKPAPSTKETPSGSWLIAGLVSAGVCVVIAVCAIVGFLVIPSGQQPPPQHVNQDKADEDKKKNDAVDPPQKIVEIAKPDDKKKPLDEKKPTKAANGKEAEKFVERLNRHRKTAGLTLVTLDSELSHGCLAHARYLARHLDPAQSANPFDEDPKKAGYTIEGERVGQNALVAFLPGAPALEHLMGRVLSRTSLLGTEMRTIGVGIDKNERGDWFCVVDPVRGRGEPIVVYPAPKQTDVPGAFSGGPDVPEPMAAAGFPISVSVPPGKQVTAARIELRDAQGKTLDGWVWTPEKQVPHAPKLNAVALVPKEILQGGALYQVKASAQVDGKPWNLAWSFTTEDDSDNRGIWTKRALAKVNAYRASAGLNPVVLDETLSQSCLKHARYLVINEGHSSLQGLKAHEEDLKLPGSSAEGDAAGRASNIAFGDYEPIDAIDGWMATLYHRVLILEPNLQSIGFGCARGRRQGWATVMNVSSGRDKSERPHAVFYPAPDQTGVPLNFPNGGEEPNPIPDDKDGRAGYPVTAFFPKKEPLKNAVATLTDANGAAVACWFSNLEKPANPKFAGHQGNTVCLIAKVPLAPKTTYQVLIKGTLAGKAWEKKWQFTTIDADLSVKDAARAMLDRLNRARTQAGLGAVALDDGLSRGCQFHAEYLVKNADALAQIKATVKDEDPQFPGFTAEGLKTARQSLVFSNAPTPVMQIDDLMATFSSRAFLLDPNLQRVGIGCSHDIGRGWRCVLDPNGGRGDGRIHVYPVPKQTDVPLLGFDRLANGKGQLGFPITVTFPQRSIVGDVKAALTDAAGKDVEIVISSPEKPFNEKRSQDTIAVHPLAALQAGQTYAVIISAIVNGKEWRQSWSFTTQK